MEKLHIPVLLSEVLAHLEPHPGDKYLDLTDMNSVINFIEYII